MMQGPAVKVHDAKENNALDGHSTSTGVDAAKK
jgi:hypothetical protein